MPRQKGLPLSILGWEVRTLLQSWIYCQQSCPKRCFSSVNVEELKRANVLGDYVLPIAAIRGEGTSNEYLPPEVPSLPAFSMLRAISSAIRDHGKDYWTGTIYTTNRRVWEYDNDFKEYLRSTHATGIDMETATLLTAGFANQIPTGALLMISDKPMEEDGVKTEASDRKVTQQFVGEQVMLGVEALQQILDGKKTIRHIRFSW